ncbi:VIT domain-containing protein [Edaphocola aurantiacus]|uniref:VIT domain-containing protein n=1 Tax=Edaphocola aurantiacus TaxID=2601682 RepID=UPI001C95FF9C|nr:VIT domain-containing protein [Edaphocola aurantiacus]
MIRQFLLCCLLLCTTFIVRAQHPTLALSDGSHDVQLDKVSVDINIVGNIATTQMTLTFLNKSDRTLEGTLTFPMPQGVTISGFALDINGKMRQAVPVSKAKATEVFESIENRRVDPGLLEQVEGNNFRTRIYPFLPHASRTIMITYEEALKLDSRYQLRYHLPLDYAQPVASFDLKATVTASTAKPVLAEQPDGSFSFTQTGPSYIAQLHKTSFQPRRALTINLPKEINTVEALYAPNTDNSAYFVINDYRKAQFKQKQWSSKIDLIWDVSLSGLERNHEKELQVLDLFFKQQPNAIVDLKLLNHRLVNSGTYAIQNGNWSALRKKLQSLVYDGATDFSVLNKAYILDKNNRDVLLFTDGMSTYGPQAGRIPTSFFTFIAAQKADFVAMQQLSSGGKLINLNTATVADAVAQINTIYYRFMGIEQANVSEVYPVRNTEVSGHMVITGLLPANMHEVTLLYGWDGKVTERRKVVLQRSNNTALNIHKLWAQQKIDALNGDYKQNAATITELAQQFGIVTRNTSLMVLEEVADYVRYNITPPQELMEEYLRLKKESSVAEEERMNDLLTRSVEMTAQLKTWWQTVFTAQKRYPQPPEKPEAARAAAVEVAEDRMVDKSVSSAHDVESQLAPAASASPVVEAVMKKEAGESNTLQFADPVTQESNFTTSAVTTYNWTATDSTATDGLDIAASDATAEATIADDGYGSETVVPVSDEPYMQVLKSSKQPYATYLRERKQYQDKATFYYNVAQYFYKRKSVDTAIQILSNIAELNIEDAPLMKILVYKLKEWKQYEKELWCAGKVLEWRPMDLQSHRDYALALEDNGRYQEALDGLYGILQGSYSPEAADRDAGVEEILVMEINRLISLHKGQLNTKHIRKELIQELPVDIRVVINWNHLNTDIDLWVTQPNGERCMYNTPTTSAGGRISNDFTNGYGPEQFLLKKAIKGKYTIETNYFGESRFVLSGATTVMAEVYLYYASGKEERKVITLQMSEAGHTQDGALIGTFTF